MIDFKKFLDESPKTTHTDPLKIFKRLDKQSGKEFLRPDQEKILDQWYTKFFKRKDTIVKMHTGQGKTLVGLLMLQSNIEAGFGPAIYLCPNTHLVKQIVKESKLFGISTVEFGDGNTIPIKFSNSEAILVTTCKKLFNGKSVFGIKPNLIELKTIVMDDAHKCLDIIRESFSISIAKKQHDQINPIYTQLWNLFESSLMKQASGTCIDMKDGTDVYIAIPFWIWKEKIHDVLEILHQYKNNYELLFVWDFIKDKLEHYTCIFAGKKIEISPRLIPIDMIKSFTNAKRRIFLSATLTEDAFLVRDLDITPDSVNEPLILKDVKYIGERMILIPNLFNSYTNKENMITWISQYAKNHGNFGVLSLVPSNHHAIDWQKEGGKITNVQNLSKTIKEFKELISNKTATHVTVLVNEYDGIDLPDATCRILCLDSIPSYASLHDRYMQEVRPNSYIIHRQLAQKIEQGFGRGIRGPSDWCIVIVIGTKLTSFLLDNTKNRFLSNETKMQIQIAEKITNEMRQGGDYNLSVIGSVIDQCINRDREWKEYYHKTMKKITKTNNNENFLCISKLEREAELFFQNEQFQKAADTIQKIINMDIEDKGWYLQLMATYLYSLNVSDSMDKQLRAHKENNGLYKPEKGISYSKLANTSNTRETNILKWIQNYDSTKLLLYVHGILDDLTFGGNAESFENGIKELGVMLGFASDRPEKISGKGPDNLWNVSGKQYWIISCKNMIKLDREYISKNETGQLNNDLAWFEQEYDGCSAKPIFIHPSKNLQYDAYLSKQSYVITDEKLKLLICNVLKFFTQLVNITSDLSIEIIKQKLAETQLDLMSINYQYHEPITPNNIQK